MLSVAGIYPFSVRRQQIASQGAPANGNGPTVEKVRFIVVQIHHARAVEKLELDLRPK